MKCLNPGGIAIHTTEYNLSSDNQTLDNSPVVLYRKSDIDWIVQAIKDAGLSMEIDYTVGQGAIEKYMDAPSYTSDTYLRLIVGNYVTTSIGLIIQKANF
jgi:hypothetical protein